MICRGGRAAAAVAERLGHGRTVAVVALTPGLRGIAEAVVAEADTARALGSGDLAVLGTPRVLGLLEAATIRAVAAELAPGRTTVGARVELDHRAPTPVGAAVRADAELVEVAGVRLAFDVAARVGDLVVARGRIVRVVVEAATFGG